MIIILNGKNIDIKENCKLSELLENQSFNLKMLAVEINNQILDKKQYNDTFLKENDKLEVVSFVGGG